MSGMRVLSFYTGVRGRPQVTAEAWQDEVSHGTLCERAFQIEGAIGR